jgi:1-pyrroline-5-carboxylate dehydrogenase
MKNGIFKIPKPVNEPILGFLPGSKEREELRRALDYIRPKFDIPLIINGKEVSSNNKGNSVPPHNHNYILAEYSKAETEHVLQAIESSLRAKEKWEEMHWSDRASIFLKAADLMSGPYRQIMNAATMLGISKNVYQAEIDVVEMIDFLRYNAYFMQQIYSNQPISDKGQWNRLEYRPLEGFVFAITPFNFISIGGNLPTSPAIMGNTVVWKPASSAVYPAYYIMTILMDAGLPPGVINFIPGQGSTVGKEILNHRDLAGVHFTGSTGTFQWIWKRIGENISKYRTYPKIVGETGGKDFVFVHPSADIDEVATALIRGSFEFQGQKCSAASRAYIPKSMWEEIRIKIKEATEQILVGDVEDFRTFVNAVIDQPAFNTITEFIDYAKTSPEAEIITGGTYDDSKGFFIQPTTILTTNPRFRTMEEEIFGPVLTCYIYEDEKFEETLRLCDETSPYALTGSIFAKERSAVLLAEKILRNAAGNFYINDKPTGAVVGHQPFGGARASGTNDKAGSYLNLIRWVSPRTIKENFIPPKNYTYGYMKEN